MKLQFSHLYLQNFMSFKEADLDLSSKGFALVVGENRNNSDGASSNGSGKSTIFEAIYWCLTGVTLRGSKDVVNKSFESDGCYVKLDFYADDKSVGALSGYTPQIQFPDDYHRDIFSSYRSCSCCWATWRDRWQNIDWDLKHFSDFISNKQAVRRLSLTGNDRLIRLYRQTKGNGSSWSVRFGAHLVINNMLTIYPRYSYVQNIGCDETGTHSQEKDAESMVVDLSKAIPNPKIENVPFDLEIQKSLKQHYSGGKLSNIKRYFATKYIVFKEKRKKSV